MFGEYLIEFLALVIYSFIGAYFFWQAHKEWVSENRYIALTFVMVGIYFASKIFWLEEVRNG